MGFRLGISEIKYNEKNNDYEINKLFYGTKLIGYYDENSLKSIGYLKLRDKDYPSSCYDTISTVLTYDEFDMFIDYYNYDLFLCQNVKLDEIDEFKNVLDSLEDEQNVIGYILEWF